MDEEVSNTKRRAASWGVIDEFWARAGPLLPVEQRDLEHRYVRKPGGGRKSKDPRLFTLGASQWRFMWV